MSARETLIDIMLEEMPGCDCSVYDARETVSLVLIAMHNAGYAVVPSPSEEGGE